MEYLTTQLTQLRNEEEIKLYVNVGLCRQHISKVVFEMG